MMCHAVSRSVDLEAKEVTTICDKKVTYFIYMEGNIPYLSVCTDCVKKLTQNGSYHLISLLN